MWNSQNQLHPCSVRGQNKGTMPLAGWRTTDLLPSKRESVVFFALNVRFKRTKKKKLNDTSPIIRINLPSINVSTVVSPSIIWGTLLFTASFIVGQCAIKITTTMSTFWYFIVCFNHLNEFYFLFSFVRTQRKELRIILLLNLYGTVENSPKGRSRSLVHHSPLGQTSVERFIIPGKRVTWKLLKKLMRYNLIPFFTDFICLISILFLSRKKMLSAQHR